MSVSLRRIGNTSSRSGSSGLSVVAARPVKRSVECERVKLYGAALNV